VARAHRPRTARAVLLPVLDLKLEPGTAFTFQTQPYPGWDGTCMPVRRDRTASQAQLRLVRPLPGHRRDLHAHAHGVGHAPVHRAVGLQPNQKREFGGARYGWKMMGGKLVDLLARIP